MKYSGKWYQVWFRWIQVKYYILTKRYIAVPNGVNFYADIKLEGLGVKGYYWKPMSYTSPVMEFDPKAMQTALENFVISRKKGD